MNLPHSASKHGGGVGLVCNAPWRAACSGNFEHIFPLEEGVSMNNIIYIVGLVVVVIAVLSFFGLR